MNDAFGTEIDIGTKVLYSVGTGGGTTYVIGEITKLYPLIPTPNKPYTPPDRVAIKPLKMTRNRIEFVKDPVLYASNVVKWEN